MKEMGGRVVGEVSTKETSLTSTVINITYFNLICSQACLTDSCLVISRGQEERFLSTVQYHKRRLATSQPV